MDTQERNARHLAELRNLEAIFKELDFHTQFVAKSSQVPNHALITRVVGREGQKPLEMVLTFYPVEPNTVEHALLLQYYIELPYTLDDESLDHFYQLLPALNSKSVLGHFGLDTDRRKLHYRYVQTLPMNRPITKTSVIDAIILVAYTPVHFSATLAALVNKVIDLHTAHTQLNARNA